MKSCSANPFYFWQHLKNVKKINIPLYQRDYVQGGEFDDAKLIRQEFIADLLDAIIKSTSKDLHFVFGGNGGDNDFVPVDGQQRLTTLYLLHWYVLARATSAKDEQEQLSKFHYASRDTSDRFCEKLVELLTVFNEDKSYKDLFFSEEQISTNIRDLPWFTGNISSDTTVKSILVVLDEIHHQFSIKETTTDDFAKYKELLLSDECPIKYLSLDMKNGLGGAQGVRDLYVKMNARGKLLTDFENFKAYLRKENTGGYDVLKSFLKSRSLEDNITERTKLLGKINNEFTNFFFKLIDNGELYDCSVSETVDEKKKPKFDTAMMNYFSEIIIVEFLIKFKLLFNDQKNGEELRNKKGKALYHFINYGAYEFCKMHYKDNEKDSFDYFTDEIFSALCKGFSKAIRILEILSDKKDSLEIVSNDEQLKNTFKSLGASSKATTNMWVSRYLIFEYIYRFEDFTSERYIAFKELVERCIDNIEFEHAYEGYNTIREFEKIIDKLSPDNSAFVEKNLWQALVSINCEHQATKYHLSEEQTKSELLLNNSEIWKQRFKDAEEIHPTKQIFYLLELSKNISQDYDYDSFDKYCSLCKILFKKERSSLVINGDNTMKMHFENSLLFSEKGNENDCYHLISEKYRQKFSHLNYCHLLSKRHEEKNEIIFDLLKTLKNNYEESNDISKSLKEIHDERKSKIDTTDWRYLFADYDIYSLSIFEESSEYKETSISKWNSNGYSYYLLYKYGTQSNAKSVVLQLAYLSLYLRNEGLNVTINPCAETSGNWEKPHSYIECNGKEIRFSENMFYVDDKICSTPEEVHNFLID